MQMPSQVLLTLVNHKRKRREIILAYMYKAIKVWPIAGYLFWQIKNFGIGN